VSLAVPNFEFLVSIKLGLLSTAPSWHRLLKPPHYSVAPGNFGGNAAFFEKSA